MWKNALFATAAVMLALLLLVFSQLDFLIPYKRVLANQYGTKMLIFLGLLAVNLYSFCFLIARKIMLQDAGRKLIHMEKQMREGSLVQELSTRLNSEEEGQNGTL